MEIVECSLLFHSGFLDDPNQHSRIILRFTVDSNQVAIHVASPLMEYWNNGVLECWKNSLPSILFFLELPKVKKKNKVKKEKPGIDILNARLVEVPPPLVPPVISVVGYQLLVIK